MSRLKGRYVSTVIINWDCERDENMLPLEEIKVNAKYLSQAVKEVLIDAVMGTSDIKVIEQYCSFWEVP